MSGAKYKILIADDSAITRGIFQKAFSTFDGFEVVELVSNGRKAVDYCKSNSVDFVISDFDMPEMNGIESCNILSKELNLPVCIYSDDASIKTAALEAGAVMFEKKPDLASYSSGSMTDFTTKIFRYCEKKVTPCSSNKHNKSSISEASCSDFKVLCIGASTGGPTAVETVLKGLGNNFPLPVLYVQHIDTGADKKMVEWFNTCCPNVPMELARDGQIAQKGKIYMAPADKHLMINHVKQDGTIILQLSDEPPERFLKPAVNKLFRSAASFFGNECLAVLLTGMGRDGAEGCKEILDNGGYTIVEDKSTCAVFGMPAAAIELKAAKKVYPRDVIASEILKLVH